MPHALVVRIPDARRSLRGGRDARVPVVDVEDRAVVDRWDADPGDESPRRRVVLLDLVVEGAADRAAAGRGVRGSEDDVIALRIGDMAPVPRGLQVGARRVEEEGEVRMRAAGDLALLDRDRHAVAECAGGADLTLQEEDREDGRRDDRSGVTNQGVVIGRRGGGVQVFREADPEDGAGGASRGYAPSRRRRGSGRMRGRCEGAGGSIESFLRG